MAEVSTAAGTMHLDPGHPEASIGRRRDGAVDRPPEAGPPGTTFVLGIRRKERLVTAGAVEGTRTLLPVERAGTPGLGGVQAENRELLGRERLPPLFFRASVLEKRFVHADSVHLTAGGSKALATGRLSGKRTRARAGSHAAEGR